MATSTKKASFDSGSLLEAAQIFAGEVVTDFETLRWRLLPLHAGAAAEFLAKAALARRSPLLLADGSANLGQKLVQLSKSSGADDYAVRTVGLGEALTRLKAVEPAFKVAQSDHKSLTAARNAAVHLGAGPSQALPLMLAFVRVCNALLPLIGTGANSFWGDAKDAAEIAGASTPGEEADANIRLALAAAKARNGSQLLLRRARAEVSAKMPLRDNEELNACPICQCLARYEGRHDRNGDGSLAFTPMALVCDGCMLKLSNRAGLSIAGAESSWISSRSAQEIQQLFGHRE